MTRPFLTMTALNGRKRPGEPTRVLRIPGSLHMDKDVDADILRLRCHVCNVTEVFDIAALDPLGEIRLHHLPNCALGQWIDDPASRTCSDAEARECVKEANDIAQRLAQAERS